MKSISLADIHPGEKVVEIGPGLGVLTKKLLESQANVYAVEYDKTLYEHIKNRFAAYIQNPDPSLHLTFGDCLDKPIGDFTLQNPNHPPFKIVANLPYAVSSPWLDRILDGPLPEKMVLMLQKEAASRYTASPGSKQFSRISIILQSAYTPSRSHNVSKTCFFPPPKVDSILVQFDRKDQPVALHWKTKTVMREIFNQRRKQLSSHTQRYPILRLWMESQIEDKQLSNRRPEEIGINVWQQLDAIIRNDPSIQP